MGNIIADNIGLSEKNVIKNIIGNSFIVDYGFIAQVSDDKTTVNVKHISTPYDRQGEALKPTQTNKVELLFPCSSNFSMTWEVAPDDGVLLLGTKSHTKKIADVKQSGTADSNLMYDQENLKALPYGFNSNPVTSLKWLSDEIKLTSTIKNTTIDLKTALQITTDADLQLTANNNKITTTSDSLKINDNLEILK
jgi:hypothetical protein